MQIPTDEILKALIAECYAKRNIIVTMFVVISLSLLMVGTNWPKRYTSFTIIQVDSTNILQGLMRGTAETTKVVDHGANAREIIHGDKLMSAILEDADWLKNKLTAVEQEQLKQDIKKQIKVENLGKNLLKISYRDSEPSRAFITAKRLAELFIEEGEKAKSRESQAAYDFINLQVNKYLKKLTAVEQNLSKFRSNNPDSRPGSEKEVSEQISRLQRHIQTAQLSLSEALIRQESLDEQLSGEAAITISQSREGQYRAKIAELQDNLERLRLDYQDTYPDIIRVNHQINDLKVSMSDEIERRTEAKQKAKMKGGTFIDESILLNPIYQQLRGKAASTQTEIATLRARISEMKKILETEFKRAKKIHGGDAALSQLTRDYEVNQGIYQDLLRRKENARVSKSLDQERSGLTFEIQEPAKLPLIPTGIRFMHFAMAGLLLGILIPIIGILILLQVDPRIRFSQVIASELEFPVLGEVREISSYSELYKAKVNIIMNVAAISVVILIYGYISWLKLSGML